MSDNKTNGKTSGKKSLKKKKKIMRIVGLALSAVEIIAAIVFAAMIFWLNMVPDKYVIIGIVVLVLITAFIVYTQFTKAHWVGKVLAVLLALIMIIGDVYIYQAKGTLSSVSGDNTKKDVVSVYVLKDDPAKSIKDAADYNFGYHAVLDKTKTEDTVKSINENVGKTIKTQTYDDFTKLVDALYNKEVGAIIVNESYVSTLEESHPDFVKDTRTIENKTYESKIKKPVIDKNTLTDTFTIYLSGNDECGELNQSGRSDVNILIEVNPKTKQILLVNTPRDYYVNVNSLTSGTGKDKLTHAGIFGVDASMATLSALYNWDIDYYVRVNFTGVEAIVDALGGITVNSEIEFTTHPDTSDVEFHFVEGKNEVNGKAALAFCRERQNIAGGDNQRGRDQMIAIQGIVDKVASPSILYNYSSVLKSVESMFQTSLDDDDIASMVKLTMEGEPWNVQTYAVTGTGTYGPSYFFGYPSLYMTEPDMNAVNTAKELLQKIKDGDVFNVDEYISEN